MQHCQNCGHETHCGTALWKEMKVNDPSASETLNVKVCNHCRCDNCQNKDTKDG